MILMGLRYETKRKSGERKESCVIGTAKVVSSKSFYVCI
jgi:hypothetical protein